MKRDNLEKQLVEYGLLLADDEREVERAAAQALNFFEALLAHKKAEPPFENKTLSQISPNKRWLLTSELYGIVNPGPGGWIGCCPTKAPDLLVVTRTACLSVPEKKIIAAWPQLHELVNIANRRNHAMFRIEQFKHPIPHKLKDIRTNSKYYLLCLNGIDEPRVSANFDAEGAVAYVCTETMNDVLRLFTDEIYYSIDDSSVILYDRWFIIKMRRTIPRLKK